MGEVGKTDAGGQDDQTHLVIGFRGGVAQGVNLRDSGDHPTGFHLQLDLYFLKESPFLQDTNILTGHGIGLGFTHSYQGVRQTNEVDLTYRYSLAQGSFEIYAGPAFGNEEVQGRTTAYSLGALFGALYQYPLMEYDCRQTDCSARMVGPVVLFIDPLRFSLTAHWSQQPDQDSGASFKGIWTPMAGIKGFF